LTDGKSIIVEGLHIDPNVLLSGFQLPGHTSCDATIDAKDPIQSQLLLHSPVLMLQNDTMKPVPVRCIQGKNNHNVGETHQGAKEFGDGSHHAILIPLVLRLKGNIESVPRHQPDDETEGSTSECNHQDQSGRSMTDTSTITKRLATVEKYLLQNCKTGVLTLEIDQHSMEDSLDLLHEFILGCIELCLKHMNPPYNMTNYSNMV